MREDDLMSLNKDKMAKLIQRIHRYGKITDRHLWAYVWRICRKLEPITTQVVRWLDAKQTKQINSHTNPSFSSWSNEIRNADRTISFPESRIEAVSI